MRICFVNSLYSRTADRGGLGEHMAGMSQALARRDHDVTIVTSGPRGETREGRVRVVRLGYVEPYTGVSQLWQPAFLAARLNYLLRLRRFVVAGGFDIVEAADGGFEQLLLLPRRRSGIVTKLHGNFTQFHGHRWLVTRLVRACESAAVRGSDAIYASSRVHASAAGRDYHVGADRIGVVPCGIDCAALRDVASDKELRRTIAPSLVGKKIVLLSAGPSPGRKGAQLLIEAARARSWTNVVFVIISAELSLFQVPPPENVVIVPTQPKAQFHRWLMAADVVVFPSTFESFSIATHEAMLLGRTLIVSDHVPLDPPARDYPWMSTLRSLDAPTLAAAIGEALAAPDARDASSADWQHALEETYDIERVADATLTLYRQVDARRRRMPPDAETRPVDVQPRGRRTAEPTPARERRSARGRIVTDTR